MNGTRRDLLYLHSDSQEIKQAFKLITEASKSVYGFETRQMYTFAKVLSHKIEGFFSSGLSYGAI